MLQHPIVSTANKWRKCAANSVLSTGISVMTVQKIYPIEVWTEVLHLQTEGVLLCILSFCKMRRNNRIHFTLIARTVTVNFRYSHRLWEFLETVYCTENIHIQYLNLFLDNSEFIYNYGIVKCNTIEKFNISEFRA